MSLQIPHAIKREHDELHSGISAAANDRGAIGTVAQRVARLVAPHFAKEESYVLPAAGILRAIASGEIRPEMRDVVELGERLRGELADMLAEHRMITAALEDLIAAARQEDKVEFAELAMRIMTHNQMEEEILYPAVIIAGDYVKSKLA